MSTASRHGLPRRARRLEVLVAVVSAGTLLFTSFSPWMSSFWPVTQSGTLYVCLGGCAIHFDQGQAVVVLPQDHRIHVSWVALEKGAVTFSVAREFEGFLEIVCAERGLNGSCSFTSQGGDYRIAFSPVFPTSVPNYALSYILEYSVPFL